MINPSELISKITQIIVNSAHPQKIIFFGSYARGDANEDSDLDFMVIQQTTEPRTRRARKIRRHLRGLKFPVDIFVYTPEEIQRWGHVPQSFVNTVMEEGQVVYG